MGNVESLRDPVRVWLTGWGAPLGTECEDPGPPPSLEETLALALRVAHEDGQLALVMPVVLWKRRDDVNFDDLVERALKDGEGRTLGFFLQMTDALSGKRLFDRYLPALMAEQPGRVCFHNRDYDSVHERVLLDLHTPEVARHWGFEMNLPLDSFASHFRKFTKSAA